MRAQLPIALCWVALLAFAHGCSESKAGSCATNRDCAASELCVQGTCQGSSSLGGCESADDCGIGEFCNNAGVCEEMVIVDCGDDSACPPNQKCNTNTGVCIDGFRSCTDEAGCAAIGYHCDTTAQECRECLDSSQCNPGYSCVDRTCVENTQNQCQADFQCSAPATVCEGGACVDGCTSPNSPIACGGGTLCDPMTGRCVPGQVTCTADVECGPPTRVCESQQCVPGCTQPGGLTCTGGNVCNSTTGRCEPPGGCSTDTQCGAPASICENNACVPGCGAGGPACGANTVCDTNTGRCVPLMGPCMLDSDCGPPASICEGGQCIGGCTQPAGLQCTGNTICNQTTGRCDPGGAVCTTDAACGAPAMICDQVSGQCISGCSTTGCTGTDVCNQGTGRCEPMQMMGNGALNSVCTQNSDCDSRLCFDLGGSVGLRCVKSCGRGADCPSGFLCTDFVGAKACVSGQLFNGNPAFSLPAGSPCSDPGQCQSGYCPASGMCVETCTRNADCGGASCGWFEYSSDFYASACVGPIGGLPAGSSCSADTECQSGVCGGTCLAPCTSTADCNNGETCFLADYSVCPVMIGPVCVGSYIANFARVCFPGAHGAGPVGTACSGFEVCRSGLCHLGIGQCTDLCGDDADCPSGYTCKIESAGQLPDGQTVWINVCLPDGF